MATNTFFINLTNKCNLNCKHCYDLKLNREMSKNVLDKSIEYICQKIKDSNENDYTINFVGGEIGLYNQQWISDAIDYIKNFCQKLLRIIYQTNLCYTLTDTHLEVLKKVDEIGTSYDYQIRFNNYSQKFQWMDNIKLLQSLNKHIRVSFTITKNLIENVSPEILYDMILGMNIYDIEFTRLLPTVSGKDISQLNPLNKDVRKWLYEAFILYEKIRKYKPLNVINFECLRDSFYGNYNWEHGRHCCLDNEVITPNGNVGTCLLEQSKPFYNIITDEYICNKQCIYNAEQELEDECNKCKYLNMCKGDCHLYHCDETGCSTPYEIYDYLKIKQELENGSI